MPIQYVGGVISSSANGLSATISLTALTGGISSSAATGDLVVVAFQASTASDLAMTLSTAGYTQLAQLYANGSTQDSNLYIGYKFMGATPDTSVVSTGTGSSLDAAVLAAKVFRGVDPANPIDVTTTTAAAIGASLPNPPAITVSTSGAMVVAAGGRADGTSAVFTSSNLTSFLTLAQIEANDAMLGFGQIENVSGTVDPAVFGGGVATSTGSWTAATVALRPLSTSAILGEASGNISFTGSSAGKSFVSGLALGDISFVGSSSSRVLVQSLSLGSIELLGQASGSVIVSGFASQDFSLFGNSSSSTLISGFSVGDLPLSGYAEGSGLVVAVGTSVGSVEFTGFATAKTLVSAFANGDIPISGHTEGVVISLTVGTVFGSFDIFGASSAIVEISSSSYGGLDFSGVSTGKTFISGVSGETISFSGVSSVKVATKGSASGTFGLVGISSDLTFGKGWVARFGSPVEGFILLQNVSESSVSLLSGH